MEISNSTETYNLESVNNIVVDDLGTVNIYSLRVVFSEISDNVNNCVLTADGDVNSVHGQPLTDLSEINVPIDSNQQLLLNYVSEENEIYRAEDVSDNDLNDTNYVPNNTENDGDSEEEDENQNRMPTNDNPANLAHEIDHGNMLEGRKRSLIPQPENWAKNKAKLSRMEGKPYIGYTRSKEGKIKHNVPKEGRKMGPSCKSKECVRVKSKQCSEITEEQRTGLFDRFWNNMNWDQRKVFVVNDPVVTDLRALKYSTDGKIYYKLNFDQDWMELPQRQKTVSGVITWPPMNNEELKIKLTKWQHLQQLKSVIPVDCHSFYDTLEHESN